MDRMHRLFDHDSLQLLRTRIKSSALGDRAHEGDGVLTGIGTVDGRPVACYAQDARVAGGSLGEAQATAIVRLLGVARDAGMPVVAFLESSGARIQEGVAALAGYASLFNEIVALSGVVPQISIVTGVCAGGSAYAPALTDFVIMTRSAAMFLTGPRIIRGVCGEDISIDELGGPRVHRSNGVCQLVVEDELEAAGRARQLLSFLDFGSRRRDLTVVDRPVESDPGGRLPSRPNQAYDVRDVILALTDPGDFLELDAEWGRNLVTGFARIDDHAVGVVANQPKFMGGVLDTHASDKAARFVELCDSYSVPLVVLVDTPGFMPGRHQESDGIIRRGAAIVRAFASARVPRFTVVLRKAYGGAYIAMNSVHLGATLAFAWPDAEIGVMDPHSAVGLIHRAALADSSEPEELLRSLSGDYRAEHCAAAGAARRGFVDEVIAPEQTRARLCSALGAFASGAPRGQDLVPAPERSAGSTAVEVLMSEPL
jgi:acetyl-CoA carboxylase carboxyltransferase component